MRSLSAKTTTSVRSLRRRGGTSRTACTRWVPARGHLTAGAGCVLTKYAPCTDLLTTRWRSCMPSSTRRGTKQSWLSPTVTVMYALSLPWAPTKRHSHVCELLLVDRWCLGTGCRSVSHRGGGGRGGEDGVASKRGARERARIAGAPPGIEGSEGGVCGTRGKQCTTGVVRAMLLRHGCDSSCARAHHVPTPGVFTRLRRGARSC